ncbi:MAG: hypothetical protein WD716_12250 [Fimbriimonadaceae bacterium]
MIWLLAGLCFVLWVGYGFWMRRSADRLRAKMHGMGRRARALLGSAGLLFGLALLAAGLYFVWALGGLGPDGLLPWAWVTVGLVGLAFVHIQLLGTAAMVTLVLDEVTARRREASLNQEQEQK